MTETARRHALRRTNAKGVPFLGTCYQCGAKNLPAEAVSWPCENPANLSKDEALILAVKGGLSDD